MWHNPSNINLTKTQQEDLRNCQFHIGNPNYFPPDGTGSSWTDSWGKQYSTTAQQQQISCKVIRKDSEDPDSIIDSNGYYVVRKVDVQFGYDDADPVAQMRLKIPTTGDTPKLKEGDFAWSQWAGVTMDSPDPTDDGFLLLAYLFQDYSSNPAAFADNLDAQDLIDGGGLPETIYFVDDDFTTTDDTYYTFPTSPGGINVLLEGYYFVCCQVAIRLYRNAGGRPCIVADTDPAFEDPVQQAWALAINGYIQTLADTSPTSENGQLLTIVINGEEDTLRTEFSLLSNFVATLASDCTLNDPPVTNVVIQGMGKIAAGDNLTVLFRNVAGPFRSVNATVESCSISIVKVG